MQKQSINLGNIKEFCQWRRISVPELADKIGMTYVGLSKILRENTTTMTTVMRIAEVLDVPAQLFFTEPEDLPAMGDFTVAGYQVLKKEAAALREENNQLKDRIIRLSDRL